MAELTYLEAIREALREVLEKDENTFLIGEDIGLYGGSFGLTSGLFAEFGPERIRDTPISESVIVGTAVGSAITGMRPILEIMFSDFTGCGMDQIMNQAAKVRYMFGGKAKGSNGTQGANGCRGRIWTASFTEPGSNICHIPGLKVVMPSCPYDAKGLLVSSIYDDNPVIFLENKFLYKNKKYARKFQKVFTKFPLEKAKLKNPAKI